MKCTIILLLGPDYLDVRLLAWQRTQGKNVLLLKNENI